MPEERRMLSSLLSKKYRFCTLATIISIIAFLVVGSMLPRTVSTLFASPDETAIAAFAHHWSLTDGFRLATNIPSILKDIPGLHPRSMVQRGDTLVPVGFLGMSMLIAPFEGLLRGSGSFITLFLVLSAAFPLWRLAFPLGRKTAWATVFVFLSFPTVLLYVNRGLFPNLPVVALVIWSCWALRERSAQSERMRAIIAGVAIGLALIIRPIEAVWFLPWIAWAAWGRIMTRDMWGALSLTIMICIAGYLTGAATYETWVPTIGYWVRDVLPVAPVTSVAGAGGSAATVLPFGFHPRAMWGNIQTYLFGMFGLWLGAALLGLASWVRGRTSIRQFIPLGLAGWTIAMLLLMYGQSVYADNIRGSAALGNSFSRYLLPLVPLIALGIGLLVERLSLIRFRGRFVAGALMCFFVLLGVTTALLRDEEGIVATRLQLLRYHAIRGAANDLVPAGAIILSDRSDKIFADGPFVPVSPMPDTATLTRIRATGVPFAVFTRSLDAEHAATFADGALGDLTMTASLAMPFENETLYIVGDRPERP